MLKAKGWNIQPILSPKEEDDIRDCWLGSKTGLRRLGDRLTWTIPFPDAGVIRNSVLDSVIEYSKFSISKHKTTEPITARCRVSVPYYKIEGYELQSSVLQYRYTYGPIMTHISRRLDSLARFELLKLKEDKQPAALMELARFHANTVFANAQMHLDRTNDDFTPPKWWTYYDKELSK